MAIRKPKIAICCFSIRYPICVAFLCSKFPKPSIRTFKSLKLLVTLGAIGLFIFEMFDCTGPNGSCFIPEPNEIEIESVCSLNGPFGDNLTLDNDQIPFICNAAACPFVVDIQTNTTGHYGSGSVIVFLPTLFFQLMLFVTFGMVYLYLLRKFILVRACSCPWFSFCLDNKFKSCLDCTYERIDGYNLLVDIVTSPILLVLIIVGSNIATQVSTTEYYLTRDLSWNNQTLELSNCTMMNDSRTYFALYQREDNETIIPIKIDTFPDKESKEYADEWKDKLDDRWPGLFMWSLVVLFFCLDLYTHYWEDEIDEEEGYTFDNKKKEHEMTPPKVVVMKSK